jgi:hypothetical protein
METIVKAAIAEFNRHGLLRRAIKPLVIALFVVCGMMAAPATASATSYDCTLTGFGVLSSGPHNTAYSESSDSAAIGVCQNNVNALAIAMCEGQGTVAPFYIQYIVRKFNPWASTVANEITSAWQCIDGYPYGDYQGEG